MLVWLTLKMDFKITWHKINNVYIDEMECRTQESDMEAKSKKKNPEIMQNLYFVGSIMLPFQQQYLVLLIHNSNEDY